MKRHNTTDQIPIACGSGKESDTSAIFVAYDIPEAAGYTSGKGTRCPLPNPSDVLRRIAARFNLSVWVVPAVNVETVRRLARYYNDHGADFFDVAVRSLDAGEIARIARRGLTRECDRIRTAIDTTIATQRAKLAAASTLADEKARASAQRTAAYETDRALRDAARALEDVEAAAVLFDVSGAVADLTTAIRASILAEETTASAERAALGLPDIRRRETTRIATVDDLIGHIETAKQPPAPAPVKTPRPSPQASPQQPIATPAAPPAAPPPPPAPAAPTAPTPTPAPAAPAPSPAARRRPRPTAPASTQAAPPPTAPAAPTFTPEQIADAIAADYNGTLDDSDPLAALAALDGE